MSEDRFRYRSYEKYLVVGTTDGTMRLVARRPSLGRNELAYQVTVRVPIPARMFPSGRLTITTPGDEPGETDVQISDQPVLDGGLARHVFRMADLDQNACARCGLSYRAEPHRCAVQGCPAPSFSGPDGAPLCTLHETDPATPT